MKQETIILLENITSGSSISERERGSGYNYNTGFQTVQYEYTDLDGSIKVQGTLSERPGEQDWVDLPSSEIVTSVETGVTVRSAVGNFVWLRAVCQVNSGTISRILLVR